jgi:Sua5/YciO/YrdC/YwlC family protein
VQAVIGHSTDEAVFWLRQGEPVALPTETVYGLAAPLDRLDIIHKIYALKQRPADNPLIVHVLDCDQLQEVAQCSPKALHLAEKFWPGPLTLVLPKKPCVPDIVTAGQPTVAVRAPQTALFREVIQKIGVPLVAPSANKFQHVSPTTAHQVYRDMGDVLHYILDGGACRFGVESTILSLLDERHPQLLRYGPIAKETLETFLGQSIETVSHAPQTGAHLSPGLYKKHYSPQTPLYLVDDLANYQPSGGLRDAFAKNAAHVFLFPPERHLQKGEFVLSEHSDLQEVAMRLFAIISELDAAHYDAIWIEKAPAKDIGNAINDRLSRAAHFDLRAK